MYVCVYVCMYARVYVIVCLFDGASDQSRVWLFVACVVFRIGACVC